MKPHWANFPYPVSPLSNLRPTPPPLEAPQELQTGYQTVLIQASEVSDRLWGFREALSGPDSPGTDDHMFKSFPRGPSVNHRSSAHPWPVPHWKHQLITTHTLMGHRVRLITHHISRVTTARNRNTVLIPAVFLSTRTLIWRILSQSSKLSATSDEPTVSTVDPPSFFFF